MGSCPSKTVHPNLGGFGEELYSDGLRVGLLLMPVYLQGLHSFNQDSNGLLLSIFSGSSDLAFGGLSVSFSGSFTLASGGLLWQEGYPLSFVDSLSSVESANIVLAVSLEGNQDPGPRLHYCILTIAPLSLPPFPSQISNCLSLPFGTPGRWQRLESVPYKQEMRDREASVLRSPTGSCLVSVGSLLQCSSSQTFWSQDL